MHPSPATPVVVTLTSTGMERNVSTVPAMQQAQEQRQMARPTTRARVRDLIKNVLMDNACVSTELTGLTYSKRV
jgi:hypothetical protein